MSESLDILVEKYEEFARDLAISSNSAEKFELNQRMKRVQADIKRIHEAQQQQIEAAEDKRKLADLASERSKVWLHRCMWLLGLLAIAVALLVRFAALKQSEISAIQQAQEGLKESRDMLDFWLLDHAHYMERMPAHDDFRRSALTYVEDRLAKQEPTAAETETEFAERNLRVGDVLILLADLHQNADRTQVQACLTKAHRLFEQARLLFNRHMADASSPLDYTRLASCHLGLASVAIAQKDYVPAATQLDLCRDILAPHHPSTEVEHRSADGRCSYLRAAMLFEKEERLQEAAAHAQRAKKAFYSLSEEPSITKGMRSRYISYWSNAMFLHLHMPEPLETPGPPETHEPPEQLESKSHRISDAIKKYTFLLSREPQRADWHQDRFALCLKKLDELKDKDHRQWLETKKKLAGFYEEMLQTLMVTPGNSSTPFLAVDSDRVGGTAISVYDNLALTHATRAYETSDPVEAVAAYQDAIPIYESLLAIITEDHPLRRKYQDNLTLCQTELAKKTKELRGDNG